MSTENLPPIEELSYEEARKELAEIVGILELGQMSLDQSLQYWERGEALAKACENHLDGAAARVEAALGNAQDSDADDASDAPQGGYENDYGNGEEGQY